MLILDEVPQEGDEPGGEEKPGNSRQDLDLLLRTLLPPSGRSDVGPRRAVGVDDDVVATGQVDRAARVVASTDERQADFHPERVVRQQRRVGIGERLAGRCRTFTGRGRPDETRRRIALRRTDERRLAVAVDVDGRIEYGRRTTLSQRRLS